MSQGLSNLKLAYYTLTVLAHLIIDRWLNIIYPIPFFNRLCYLTGISFYLNTVYYVSMLLIYLKQITFYKSFEQSLFKISYLISFVVFILYWSIVLINPSLVLEQKISFPFVLDFFLHGVNFVLNLVEAKIISPKQNFKFHYLFYLAFCVTYGVMLKVMFHAYGWAVYPFVAVGILEYLTILIMGLGLIILGDMSYSKITGFEEGIYQITKNKLIVN
jgi:hypothetical protein